MEKITSTELNVELFHGIGVDELQRAINDWMNASEKNIVEIKQNVVPGNENFLTSFLISIWYTYPMRGFTLTE